MGYKPIQVGQINTAQVSGYSAKPAEIVFDDQINKLHLGGTDAKLKGVRMDNEDAWATCATAASTTAKVATAAAFTLKAGSRVTVKFTSANTASAPTLNVNNTDAKALKKPNGNTFTNIVAGGVYAFVYDGTNFIAQSEGGEYGTATASDVLSGKTIGTENGLVTGTIALKAAATITPGTSNQTIAAGQYLSGVQTIKGDTDLVASNIKNGVDIFGVVGTLTAASLGGKKYATGTITSLNLSKITITSLNFTPKYLMIYAKGASYYQYFIYFNGLYHCTWASFDGSTYSDARSTTKLTVNNDGFELIRTEGISFGTGGSNFSALDWIAFE